MKMLNSFNAIDLLKDKFEIDFQILAIVKFLM